MPLHLAKLKYLSICLLVALVGAFLVIVPATTAQATTIESTPSQATPTEAAPTQAAPIQAAPTQAAPTESVDATKPFNAPLCKGKTSNDPTRAKGPVKDLTLVFGQRLEDYHAGRTVILYSGNGTNGGTPNCAVQYVEGLGAVSDWMYCTDHTSTTCSVTNAKGQLTSSNVPVGSMVDREKNARLTADQERIIAFLLHFDQPVSELPNNLAPGAVLSSDATSASRYARQSLIWCVSDRASFNRPNNAKIGAWCDANMPRATQATILNSMNEAPLLTLSPAKTEGPLSSTAKVELTTNLFNRPLEVGLDNASMEVCGGQATLSDGFLTVPGTESVTQKTVTLCLTYTNSTEVSLTVRGASIELGGLRWSQSMESSYQPCQVYIHRSAASTKATTASARVLFASPEVPTGGFSLKKLLTGTGAAAVPATTEFVVEYTVDGGPAQTVALTSTGAPTMVAGLPLGATIEVRETAIPTVAGVIWATPAIAVDGYAAGTPATFTLAEDRMVEVVVTNSATTVATPLVTSTQATSAAALTTPGVEPTTAPATDATETLASTGWANQIALVSVALLLLGAVALLAVQRRRQRGIHS